MGEEGETWQGARSCAAPVAAAASRLPRGSFSRLPFPALLFLGCPGEQKHARTQQPYWDGALLNCGDCGEARL